MIIHYYLKFYFACKYLLLYIIYFLLTELFASKVGGAVILWLPNYVFLYSVSLGFSVGLVRGFMGIFMWFFSMLAIC